MDVLKAMGKEALTKVTGTELEKKIAEACCNKPWGASSTMLAEIAQATYNYQEYPVVMAQVWKRVGESTKVWRVVYKALNLLEFLIRNGSERCVEDARDHMYQLRSLQNLQHTWATSVGSGGTVAGVDATGACLVADQCSCGSWKKRLLEETPLDLATDGLTTVDFLADDDGFADAGGFAVA